MSGRYGLAGLGAPPAITMLAALLVLAHGVRWWLGASGEALVFDAGRLSGDWRSVVAGLPTLVTHVFVHADGAHLLLNVAAFYVAGREVTGHASAAGTVAVLIAAAGAGAMAHAVLYGPGVALFGASAGVAGLMAVWLRLAVHNRRVFLALALFWLVLNYPGIEGADAGVTPTAWEAHVGGFLFGLVFGPSVLRLFPAYTKSP